jgi:putative phosphoribosyl transferase
MSTSHVGQAIEHLPVNVRVHDADLEGYFSVPTDAIGAVIFAHGSGSSRHSPRNRYVAEILNEGRLATLLIDLLNEQEQEVDLQTAQLRFDIPFLAARLVAIAQWLGHQPQARGLNLGYFGASTGAGAALVAAAELPAMIHAVVSRGGRIDLAGPALAKVHAPTLAIVGGADPLVLELNRRALAQMHCPTELRIIPGAGHLFSEPGTLEQVAMFASNWFAARLGPGTRAGFTDLVDAESSLL